MAQILLIDDDPNLLQMVKLMLERAGHTVEMARDGEQGIMLAQRVQPDIAIVDVMMPDTNGYDVVRAMRADRQTAAIPVIILTARSQPMDKHMALEAGANSFLSKPVAAKELLARIEAVLEAGVGFHVHTGMLKQPITPRPPLEDEAEPEPPVSDSRPSRPTRSRPVERPATHPVERPVTRPPQEKPARRMPIGAEDVSMSASASSKLLPAITVLSLRGGVGTTTLAVNLSLVLSGRGDHVALLDLSLASGHAHLHMHMPGGRNWGRLLEYGDAPDPELVLQLLTQHGPSGLSLLAAPSVPVMRALSTPATLTIMRDLTADFTRLVIDARSLNSATAGALSVSSVVLVVMTDDPPSIQSAGQLLMTLHNFGVDPARVRLALNHIRTTTDVPVDTIQKALKRPINIDLPYDPGHMDAIRRGVPVVVSNPDGPFARALKQFANTLVF